MEQPMSEPNTSAPPPREDEAIRQRVKGLTSQVLQQGRVDPEAVRDIARAMMGGAPAATGGGEARALFVEAVHAFDAALVKSAGATHEALQQLAARGANFSDNDLKEALATLRKLEQDLLAAAKAIAEAMGGNLRREMTELATHAQNVGVEASARVAGMMGDIAGGVSGIGNAPGLAQIRGAGARMALLASGVLAGVADALRDQSAEMKGQAESKGQ
jgi:hypothetical protein